MTNTMMRLMLIPMLGFAIPAYAANCDTQLDRLDKKISTNENSYRIVSSGISRDIRQLRDAARIFSRYNQDDACLQVVSSTESLLESRRTEMNKNTKDKGSDWWTTSEASRLKSAVSVEKAKRNLTASEIIGADVRNMQNKDLGYIDDIILQPDSNEIDMVVVSYGGFLGVGGKYIAVPWSELQVTTDDEERVYVLNMSEEMIKNAPAFDRENWSDLDSDEWRKQNRIYYQNNHG